MNVSDQADMLFRRVARQFGLSVERRTYGNGEHSFVFPIQDGLQEEVSMWFDNHDEIEFRVGNYFTRSAFPFPDVADSF